MRDVMSLAEEDTRLKRVSIGEYAGPCPRCGGNDRFHVNLRKKEGGAWMCRGCWDASAKGWGDAIEYLRQMRGMSFSEAKAYAEDGEVARVRVNKAIRRVETYGKAPEQDWQERALKWIAEAVERLWGPEGLAALEYLRGRGLRDETIKAAKLGYARCKHPKTKQVVPCVVFPWVDKDAVWRVQLRDIRPGIPHDERYFMLPGSSNAGLYLADSLRLKRDLLFMVEGEIDALTIFQECGDLAGVVATGSTNGSRTPQWIGRLARAGRVLIAYDSEPKGEENADYWLRALENAIRYRPIEHDVNDMLLQGYDVRSWASAFLEPAAQPVEQEMSEQELDIPLCVTCLDLGIETPGEYQHEEFMYCAQHRPGDSGQVAQPVEPAPVEQEMSRPEVCSSPAGRQAIETAQKLESSGVRFSLQGGQVYYDADYPLSLNIQRFIFNHKQVLLEWLQTRQPVDVPRTPQEQLLAVAQRIATEVFPEGCAISDIRPATTFTAPAGHRIYTPLTLDGLTRSLCPFEVVYPGKREGNAQRIEMKVCAKAATYNGWCEEHKHAHTLLALGAKLGYPQLQIHECRGIEAGVASWEAYACRATGRALKNDLPKLKAMADKKDRALAPA